MTTYSDSLPQNPVGSGELTDACPRCGDYSPGALICCQVLATRTCSLGCPRDAVALVDNVPACDDHFTAAVWATFNAARAGGDRGDSALGR